MNSEGGSILTAEIDKVLTHSLIIRDSSENFYGSFADSSVHGSDFWYHEAGLKSTNIDLFGLNPLYFSCKARSMVRNIDTGNELTFLRIRYDVGSVGYFSLVCLAFS